LNSAHTNTLDCVLDQPRGHGILDELVQIRKPSRLPFGHRNPGERHVESVVYNTRAGEPGRKLNQGWTGRGQDIDFTGPQEIKTGRYCFDGLQFGLFDCVF